MRTSHGGVRSRRLCGFAGVLVLSGLALGVAQPAAASYSTTVRPVSWAYTDSRQPSMSFVDGAADSRVGSWRDDAGKHHKSRAYFTYDLSAFGGKLIVSAKAFFAETAVNDCSHPRTLELWQTSPVTAATSWANPPQEIAKVADIGGSYCPSNYLEVNLTQVAAQGQSTVTVELRVPQDAEGDLHLGRSVRHDAPLVVRADLPPNTPTDLAIDGQPCDGAVPVWISTLNPFAAAMISDPDPSDGEAQPISATFAVWPQAHPEDRLEWTSSENSGSRTSVFSVPDGRLSDGESYVFSVRANDDQTHSAWSPECHFTVDTQRPNAVPIVASTDYPDDGQFHTGSGIAGQFTFSPNGISDVAGYRYGISYPGNYVAAQTLGGSVSVSITPTSDGIMTLYVYSVDRAGNVSDVVTYTFLVRDSAPRIEDLDTGAWAGDPHRLIFHPNMDNVASYTYRIDDGLQQTVAAAIDGTAQVSVTPAITGSTIYVYSVTSAAVVSREVWISLSSDTRPIVTSAQFPQLGSVPVGRHGTFTLAPHMHDVAAYVYQFNRGKPDQQPPVTVAAGPDGIASIAFTPTRAGSNTLSVYSVTSAGVRSRERNHAFTAISIAPDVFCDAYPSGEFSGGIGVTAEFLFVPNTADVISYTYKFGDEPEQTIAANEDNAAFISWTPATTGYVQLLVRSHSADGTTSDPRSYLVAIAG